MKRTLEEILKNAIDNRRLDEANEKEGPYTDYEALVDEYGEIDGSLAKGALDSFLNEIYEKLWEIIQDSEPDIKELKKYAKISKRPQDVKYAEAFKKALGEIKALAEKLSNLTKHIN